MICAAALLLHACGGDGSAAPGPGAEPAGAPLPQREALSSRPHDGIIAAGGRADVLGGAQQCSNDDAITVAYVGPDLSHFDAIGLEALVIEEPSVLIGAYLDAINSAGGIAGRCLHVDVYLWDPVDPDASYERICAELPNADPLFALNFLGDIDGIECVTVQEGIPTLGLYASAPTDMVAASQGQLFLDDGTHDYLLENSIEVALRSGYLRPDSLLGFLEGAGSGSASVDAAQQRQKALLSLVTEYGIDIQSVQRVRGVFSDIATLLPEEQTRILRSGLSASEQAAADAARDSLAPRAAEMVTLIEDFYLKAAAGYRDAGVEVIVSTAPWYELRRLMRAAALADWHPWWIASDVQGATLTLTGAPASQAERFLLVSARRAAGDEVPAFDRGCVVLRNTATAATPFAHRHHTDAWSVVTATCDLLDVAMSAVTRAAEPLSSESFTAAMRSTDYRAAYGGHLSFAQNDSSGADRFRVLQADPDCVLDEWGCMRPETDWLAPVAQARDSAP